MSIRRVLAWFLPAAALSLLVAGVSFAAPRLGDLGALVQRLNGSPQYNQSISVDNTSDISAAFVGGETLLIQPSAEVYCRAVTAVSGTATTTNGVKLVADEKFYLTLKSNELYVACITASSSSTVRIWTME